MEIIPVSDPRFRAYGQVLEGYDFSPLIEAMERTTPAPGDGTVYVASDPALEELPVFAELRDRGFGGLDVQLAYCNGTNYDLTCLEYHRSSEIDIACDDMILLLALQPEMGEDFSLSTDKVKAFLVPKGTAVEMFATTLHYAPCSARMGETFRMGCVLPRGTNTGKPLGVSCDRESRLMTARNKWLIASAGTGEAAEGAHVGIFGPGITLFA